MIEQQNEKWKIGILAVVIIVAIIAIVALSVTGIATLDLEDGNDQNAVASQNESVDNRDLFPDKAYPQYANGFSVEYHGTYKVVTINDDRYGDETYLLVQRGEEVPDGYPDASVFTIPVESVITLSSPATSFISALDETESIKGHKGIKLIHDENFQQLASDGKIVEVGYGQNTMDNRFITETMLEIEPDVVFCNPASSSQSESSKQSILLELGLKPATVFEYREEHLLGRTEWIKYISLFYNKEKDANEFFNRVVTNYTAISTAATNAASKPGIISGIDSKGTWSAPGGDSYVAILFRDAGGNYLLGNESVTGNSHLDLESVYIMSQDADFWINAGTSSIMTSDELLARDFRYEKFKPFQTGMIYNNNARKNDFGGNDYWQSGVVHPDILLADLVKIMHPELLPDHELYYFRQIDSGQQGENV